MNTSSSMYILDNIAKSVLNAVMHGCCSSDAKYSWMLSVNNVKDYQCLEKVKLESSLHIMLLLWGPAR